MKPDTLGTLSESLTYVEQRHHAVVRGFLESIQELMIDVLTGPEKEPSQHKLKSLNSCFLVLKMELNHHLTMEEQVVFPLIRNLENQRAVSSPSDKYPVKYHLNHLTHEHEYILQLLSEIRRLTGIFHLPLKAAPLLQELYEQLRQMHDDLNEHIKFEQSFIFPKVDEAATRQPRA